MKYTFNFVEEEDRLYITENNDSYNCGFCIKINKESLRLLAEDILEEIDE